MEEYTVSKLWKLLYWAVRVSVLLLVIAGLLANLLFPFLLSFGCYLFSLWLKRSKNECPGCGGILDEDILHLGRKETVCRACGAHITVR